jgi:cell division protein FtsL
LANAEQPARGSPETVEYFGSTLKVKKTSRNELLASIIRADGNMETKQKFIRSSSTLNATQRKQKLAEENKSLFDAMVARMNEEIAAVKAEHSEKVLALLSHVCDLENNLTKTQVELTAATSLILEQKAVRLVMAKIHSRRLDSAAKSTTDPKTAEVEILLKSVKELSTSNKRLAMRVKTMGMGIAIYKSDVENDAIRSRGSLTASESSLDSKTTELESLQVSVKEMSRDNTRLKTRIKTMEMGKSIIENEVEADIKRTQACIQNLMSKLALSDRSDIVKKAAYEAAATESLDNSRLREELVQSRVESARNEGLAAELEESKAYGVKMNQHLTELEESHACLMRDNYTIIKSSVDTLGEKDVAYGELESKKKEAESHSRGRVAAIEFAAKSYVESVKLEGELDRSHRKFTDSSFLVQLLKDQLKKFNTSDEMETMLRHAKATIKNYNGINDRSKSSGSMILIVKPISEI